MGPCLWRRLGGNRHSVLRRAPGILLRVLRGGARASAAAPHLRCRPTTPTKKKPGQGRTSCPLLDGMTARRRLPPTSGRDRAASPPSSPAPKKGHARWPTEASSQNAIARHEGDPPPQDKENRLTRSARDKYRWIGSARPLVVYLRRLPATPIRAGDVILGQSIRPHVGRRLPPIMDRGVVVRQANLTAQNATHTALSQRQSVIHETAKKWATEVAQQHLSLPACPSERGSFQCRPGPRSAMSTIAK